MLIARHGFLSKMLLMISGDELLTKLTTPERNWVSQVLGSPTPPPPATAKRDGDTLERHRDTSGEPFKYRRARE
jgi:hypothetical protein